MESGVEVRCYQAVRPRDPQLDLISQPEKGSRLGNASHDVIEASGH